MEEGDVAVGIHKSLQLPIPSRCRRCAFCFPKKEKKTEKDTAVIMESKCFGGKRDRAEAEEEQSSNNADAPPSKKGALLQKESQVSPTSASFDLSAASRVATTARGTGVC
jgi:hypothetical protein